MPPGFSPGSKALPDDKCFQEDPRGIQSLLGKLFLAVAAPYLHVLLLASS